MPTRVRDTCYGQCRCSLHLRVWVLPVSKFGGRSGRIFGLGVRVMERRSRGSVTAWKFLKLGLQNGDLARTLNQDLSSPCRVCRKFEELMAMKSSRLDP